MNRRNDCCPERGRARLANAKGPPERAPQFAEDDTGYTDSRSRSAVVGIVIVILIPRIVILGIVVVIAGTG
jgi:hypothetical protein